MGDRRLTVLSEPPAETFLADNLKAVRDRLAQVPEGKTGALVLAVDWKAGVVPVFRTGLAHRTANGWEISGDAFISKTEKGASVKVAKTW